MPEETGNTWRKPGAPGGNRSTWRKPEHLEETGAPGGNRSTWRKPLTATDTDPFPQTSEAEVCGREQEFSCVGTECELELTLLSLSSGPSAPSPESICPLPRVSLPPPLLKDLLLHWEETQISLKSQTRAGLDPAGTRLQWHYGLR
uniref:Uncharacterized protein n=1 Tax=Knipowitschia caucasica TaxID=637954 RepID=A0AAV2KS22_KNICA